MVAQWPSLTSTCPQTRTMTGSGGLTKILSPTLQCSDVHLDAVLGQRGPEDLVGHHAEGGVDAVERAQGRVQRVTLQELVQDWSLTCRGHGCHNVGMSSNRQVLTMTEAEPSHWSPTVWDRFWSKVDASGDCWEWTAALAVRGGYGWFNPGNDRPTTAHRVAWRLLVGPLPEGLELDHLCRNPPCVNPDHLEPVSHSENVRRGASPRILASRRGTCQRGHPRSESVLRRGTDRVVYCKTCRREKRRGLW